MATIEECLDALDRLAENLSGASAELRGAAALDRSLSCHVTDLDATFTGHLRDGHLKEVRTLEGAPEQRAEIALEMTSEDLVALVDGRLHFARAWASGRVRVKAPLRDLLRLRSVL
ncbi:sterol-binding protein [Streptomyces cinnamoneus]|uniref:Sterol-binding protein n=1 Tax=Streptomyces cinnamoneus TaxID=53446 RepID=A0A2G1XB23_STRCJ|nr:alkyl sulfatase C-terminal domain-containing protein [Streptomyces cinnamoneus]PHQ48416.1 sterol-binding protein [Streptomyces cinnamoneus]PPT12588.1 sterol-binding protein [Streptomyces cinnamoneus]